MPRISPAILTAVATATVALSAAGLLGGCDPGGSAAHPAAGATGTTAGGSAAGFGGTDLAWIEITIGMDEELLPVLALAPGHASSASAKAAASQVKSFTDSELRTLRTLHDEAGLPAQNPHEGMTMPGMVTPDQVAADAKLSGAAFDSELVAQLRAHLVQGEKLAHEEIAAGTETRTKNLALQVLKTRAAALDSLK